MLSVFCVLTCKSQRVLVYASYLSSRLVDLQSKIFTKCAADYIQTTIIASNKKFKFHCDRPICQHSCLLNDINIEAYNVMYIIFSSDYSVDYLLFIVLARVKLCTTLCNYLRVMHITFHLIDSSR